MITAALILLTSLCAGTVGAALVRRLDPLGFPLLAAAAFAFLYVWQPAFLLWTGKLVLFLSDDQVAYGVLVAAMMLSAILAGWYVESRSKAPHTAPAAQYDYRKLYARGVALGALGVGLYIGFLQQSGGVGEFYSAVHGTAGAWTQQTAWVYFGPYLAYPGLATMLIAARRTRARWTSYIPVAVFSVLALAHAVLTASRGVFFPLAVTLGVTPYLASGTRPRPMRVLGAGVTVGAAILLLVGFRDHLHLGESDGDPRGFVEALLMTSDISDESIRANEAQVEFVYHAGVVETVDVTEKLAYGAQWLYLVTIHPIPRILWPGKPYGIDAGITLRDIASVMGWVRSSGSAYALAADLYIQLGQAGVVLAFGLGWIARRLFRRATAPSAPPDAIAAYVLFYAWSLHLLAQGVSALIVPYLYVLVPAVLIARSCRVGRSRGRPALWARRGGGHIAADRNRVGAL